MNILNPIVYLGVDPDHQDIKTTRTIITVNYFSLVTSMVAMFCGFCIYYMVTKNRFIYIPASIECLGFITIIYLNYLHYQRIATTTFYLLQNIAVFYFAVALGEAGGAIVMVIFLFGLSFLLFQNPLNRTMAATLATINLTILIFIYNYKLIEPVFTPPAGPTFIKFIIYPVIFLHISLLFVLHEKNYNRIIRILTLTKEELRLRSLELERVSNIKSVILAENSHEMRSPLNAMFLIIESLRKDILSQKTIEKVDDLYYTSYLLRSIINNVLQLSKIETGEFESRDELKMESICFRKWLLEIIAVYQYIANIKNVQIKLQISEDMPKYILGDMLKLTQAVVNILGNAVKFTKQESEILIGVKVTGADTFSIQIKDQGMGIEESHLKEIFQLYVTSDRNGSGIGLYVSKRVIEKCGGSIRVESSKGHGSNFIFENLPLIIGEPIQEYQNITDKNFYGLKILVIDDDELVNKYLLVQLKELGFFTHFASTGEKGLSIAEIEKPDIIILDFTLQDQTGMDVLKKIKASFLLKNIPVIMMTAYLLEDLKEELSENTDFFIRNIGGYVTKPTSLLDLNTLLNKLLLTRSIQEPS